MAHTVLYMGAAPQAHREVTLSVEPDGFENVWLERDDTPDEVRAKLAEADFIVTGSISAEQIAQATSVKLMMLAILKHLTEAHNALKEGRWIHNDLRHTALMLEHKRVGILGLGRIG